MTGLAEGLALLCLISATCTKTCVKPLRLRLLISLLKIGAVVFWPFRDYMDNFAEELELTA